MEDSLENLISYLEMEDDILNESNSSFDEQEFLKEIILDEEDDSNRIQQNNIVDETIYDNLNKSNSSNSIMSFPFSPTTCLLSFDNSSVDEQVIHEPKSNKFPMGSKRKSIEKDGFEKKSRRSSPKIKTVDHLLAERKRRRELTESIIQLSAMIPGLKKMDKAYVLVEAVNYTKQLQKRVKELENQNEAKRVNSAISIWKSQASTNNIKSLVEVEVRVLEKKVLIRILFDQKQNDIVLKTHALLEKLHFSVTSSSVLPFGTSILTNNIVAQMDDEHDMATDDLVKNLRECLLEGI